MNNKIITLPPFIHSEDRLYNVWKDMLISIVCVIITIIFMGSAYVYLLLKTFFVFYTLHLLYNIFLFKNINRKDSLIRYTVGASFLILIMPHSVPFLTLFICAGIAYLIEDLLIRNHFKVLIPGFVLTGIFIYSVHGYEEYMYSYEILIPASAGFVYLIFKKRNYLASFSGFFITLFTYYFFNMTLEINDIVLYSLVPLLICGYPGILPTKKYTRFIFGVIGGILIFNFNIYGFFVIVMLKPILNLL